MTAIIAPIYRAIIKVGLEQLPTVSIIRLGEKLQAGKPFMLSGLGCKVKGYGDLMVEALPEEFKQWVLEGRFTLQEIYDHSHGIQNFVSNPRMGHLSYVDAMRALSKQDIDRRQYIMEILDEIWAEREIGGCLD